jgi:hypothetical protein
MHITGAVHDGSRLRDSMPMTEADWDLAEWSLNKALDGAWRRPWIVALEYGGLGPTFEWRSDIGVLESELKRLDKLVRKRDSVAVRS